MVTSVEPPLGVDQVLARNKFDCCAPFENLKTNGEIGASCLKASLERLPMIKCMRNHEATNSG